MKLKQVLAKNYNSNITHGEMTDFDSLTEAAFLSGFEAALGYAMINHFYDDSSCPAHLEQLRDQEWGD